MLSLSAKKAPETLHSKRKNFTKKKARALAIQLGLLATLGALICYGTSNAIYNLQKQGIASGFGFLERMAGFGIIQHLMPYDENSTYGRAFVVACLNTIAVSFLGIVLSTVIGFGLGIARISKNFFACKLSLVYTETLRNVPLLLQIFFWYFGVLRTLPMPDKSYHLGSYLWLNIRGLYLPNPFTGDMPQLGRFNVEGGLCLLPEFIALLLALTTYTAAFTAEVVRAGLLSVPKGQWEAALALGLSRRQALHLVIRPQAMTVIIPPLTSQWLNVTKNSSLGAAIGYPEIALVFAGTVLLQTGQAVEVMTVTMVTYLAMSLFLASMGSLYSKMRLRHEKHLTGRGRTL
jgi:general L-amino acid transport system permease protein